MRFPWPLFISITVGRISWRPTKKKISWKNIISLLTALFGLVGAIFGIFEKARADSLTSQVNIAQNDSQQISIIVASMFGENFQISDLI